MRTVAAMIWSRRHFLVCSFAGLAVCGLVSAEAVYADDLSNDPELFHRYSIDQEKATIVTTTGDYPFLVDIVMNQQTPDSTLRARRPIQPDQGILYAYDVVRHIAISNAGVPFATDLMFITADGRIIEIYPEIMPNSSRVIVSNIPVKAALQVIAGTVQRLDVTPGDYVLHKIFGRTL